MTEFLLGWLPQPSVLSLVFRKGLPSSRTVDEASLDAVQYLQVDFLYCHGTVQ